MVKLSSSATSQKHRNQEFPGWVEVSQIRSCQGYTLLGARFWQERSTPSPDAQERHGVLATTSTASNKQLSSRSLPVYTIPNTVHLLESDKLPDGQACGQQLVLTVAQQSHDTDKFLSLGRISFDVPTTNDLFSDYTAFSEFLIFIVLFSRVEPRGFESNSVCKPIWRHVHATHWHRHTHSPNPFWCLKLKCIISFSEMI